MDGVHIKINKRKKLEHELLYMNNVYIEEAQGIPCLKGGCNISEIFCQFKEEIQSLLDKHGAIYLPDGNIRNKSEFKEVVGNIIHNVMENNGEHKEIPDIEGVYNPVTYTSGSELLAHNENSFNHSWPHHIAFSCQSVPTKGGQTFIADSFAMFELMESEIVNAFVEKGVKYVRTMGLGVGLDWRIIFNTEEKEVVEEKCNKQKIKYEWLDDEILQTSAVRPAIVEHPLTKRISWFNQVQHWHTACLDEDSLSELITMFGKDRLPRQAVFGDGTEIPKDMIARILNLYTQLSIDVNWKAGGLILIDNISKAHGRRPYIGARELLVMMGNMRTFSNKPNLD